MTDTVTVPRETFQDRVLPWLIECFGAEIAGNIEERCDRFIEEALEQVQALNWPPERALALVEYVYGRPAGDPHQEAGGVMVTFAALCQAAGLNMEKAGNDELARIMQPEIVQKIRAKQAAKPTGSALPVAAPKAEPVSDPYKLVREAISNLIEWDKETGFRVPYRVRDPLYSALALIQPLSNPQQLEAQPEAQKVEQKPVAWRYRSAERPHLGWTKPEYSRRSPCGRIGMDEQPLFTHPAPASDELLEALKPFAEAAVDLDDGETGHIWERPAAMNIDASDLRRAADLIAKHKGPQS